MADASGNTSTQGPPDWFVRACRWLWKKRGFFWGTISLGIALNVIASLLFIRWPLSTNKNLDGTLVQWLIQNPIVILVVGVFLLLLMYIIYLGSRFNVHVVVPGKQFDEVVVDPEKDIQRRYLDQIRQDTELLTLKGIPAGLISESVHLDEVFIPLQFRPNRPKTDYPLTEKELEEYRELRRIGSLSAEQESVLIDAENNWQYILKQSDKISIADLWQRLSKEQPVAVIQGAPGMGKSTLMERLTLHMVRRCLGQPDPEMPEHDRFGAPLIPILLRLGEYATVRGAAPDLSLEDYLKAVLAKFNIPGLDSFMIEKCLKAGRCLVLLDGLDEVSHLEMREQVQAAIRDFIRAYRNAPGEGHRFIITSRIAGYDQAAFPAYLHFAVAELTPEQIDDFLPRWSQANVRRSLGVTSARQREQDAVISSEAKQRLEELRAAVQGNKAIQELAGNPLLVTLLAVMQQNSIELPRQRVELYYVITFTLLENRNIAKNLIPIPEGEAIKRLGPLAYEMQEKGNSFALESEVITSLRETIGQAGGTHDEIAREADTFLERIRVRGGLFVKRTGDYYAFLHRTFQEYFAARYVLNKIELQPITWIPKLVNMARRSDALWREPFLLAVAYQSKANKKLANDILCELLADSPGAGQEEQDVLLAAECVVESKPQSIEGTLETRIANQLLQVYEQAQRSERFEICDRVEGIMQRWLLSLPREAYRPPLVAALYVAITDTTSVTRQCATLTLLSMIAQQLDNAPSLVFSRLIPPLLALAGLPAIGEQRPAADVPAASDFNVADLALSVLSFMGQRGPAGSLLADVRQYFKDHPAHLRLLARYSLESGTLFTFAVVPLEEENYRRYEAAIGQWIKLRDSHKTHHVTEQEIDTCLGIHQALLDCAEEVSYPAATHLLHMLQASTGHPDPRQETWQSYLLDQLKSCQYIAYQEFVLLWVSLFQQEQAQGPLVFLLLYHYNSDGTSVQRYAQRFLATLSTDLRDLRALRYMRSLQDIRYIRTLRNMRDIKDIRDIRDMRYIRYVRDIRYIRGLRDLRGLRILRDIRDMLFVKEVADKAIKLLSRTGRASLGAVEQVDLLTLLLGRVLQIQEASESGHNVEREIKEIVQTIQLIFTSTGNDEVSEVALDILNYLPARSTNEIQYVLQLVNDATYERIQIACANALRFASPGTPEAWPALELGRQSKGEGGRKAGEKRWERRGGEKRVGKGSVLLGKQARLTQFQIYLRCNRDYP